MSSDNVPKSGALLGALILQGCAHQPLSSPPEHYLQVSSRVALAAPIPGQNIKQLQRDQYLVIDLRTEAEDGQRQQQQAYRHEGIAYQHIPVTGAVVTNTQINKLAEALSTHSDNPVVIQCASGNRAALLWATYRITQGDAPGSAEAAVAPIATKTAVVEAIRQFAVKQE